MYGWLESGCTRERNEKRVCTDPWSAAQRHRQQPTHSTCSANEAGAHAPRHPTKMLAQPIWGAAGQAPTETKQDHQTLAARQARGTGGAHRRPAPWRVALPQTADTTLSALAETSPCTAQHARRVCCHSITAKSASAQPNAQLLASTRPHPLLVTTHTPLLRNDRG